MSKIYKISLITIMIVLMICFLNLNYVKAANVANVTAQPNKTTLNPGDELKIDLLISDITIQNGIISYGINLTYDSNVFEIETEQETTETQTELSTIKTQLQLDTIKILSMDDLNSSVWNVLIGTTSNKNLIIGTTDSNQTQNQKIGQIKLRVKSNARFR